MLHTVHGIETPKTTLWRALKRWGFTHGEGRKRDSLKEQSRVILARRYYLRAKLANRNSDGTYKRPEVYLDKTYIKSMTYRLKPVVCFGRKRPLRLKPSELFG